MQKGNLGFYKTLFDEARDGMWVINPLKQQIMDVNKALIELCGYSKEEMLAMPPANISPNPDDTKKIMKEALGPGGEIFLERAVKKKDGTIIPVEISARSVTLDDYRVIIGIFRDIRTQKQADDEKTKLILELKQALQEVKTLSGLLPICSSCKKIRDDKGYWTLLEKYIQDHSEAQFSHGICPDCCEVFYGDEKWFKDIKAKKD